MDFNTAIASMWRHADKHERMTTFDKIVREIGVSDPEVFWNQFWSIWASSENLNDDSAILPDLIKMGLEIGDPLTGMDEDARAEFDKLVFPLVVYRGCTEHNVTGWSWTHDRGVAEMFVKRAAGPGQRMIAKAVVQREDVLGYLTGRGESELVINGAEIDYVIDEKFETAQGRNDLYYAIQSGRMLGSDDPQMIDARVTVMLHGVLPPYDKHIAHLEKEKVFVEWAGLSRAFLTNALLAGLYERRDNPNFKNPFDGEHFSL